MSEKRKDSKGRILRTGESERKNRTYQYRYKPRPHSEYKTVYAPSLEELRKKEAAIQHDLLDGIDYSKGEITVIELVDRYMKTRHFRSENTQRAYSSPVKRIRGSAFGQQKINSIRQSDAKILFTELHNQGLKRNTIEVMQNVLRPAFRLAVDDDILRKNPFDFSLSDILPDDAVYRDALSTEHQEIYLDFLKECGSGYYYDILILLETGLRVSELYGLIPSDIDFKNDCIHVRRQLCRTGDKTYFVKPPKTDSGIRNVPMSPKAKNAFLQVIKQRGSPSVEIMVDGYSGFIFLDKNMRPRVGMHLQNHMRTIQKKLWESIDPLFPRVTPHVMRHTFSTNMHNRGLDIKSLQYIMGHSSASITLDIYTHTDYATVSRSFFDAVASL